MTIHVPIQSFTTGFEGGCAEHERPYQRKPDDGPDDGLDNEAVPAHVTPFVLSSKENCLEEAYEGFMEIEAETFGEITALDAEEWDALCGRTGLYVIVKNLAQVERTQKNQIVGERLVNDAREVLVKAPMGLVLYSDVTCGRA